MRNRKGILIDSNDNIVIKNGTMAIGESEMQEVSLLLRMNPGELKSDPIIGAGLVRMIKSNTDKRKIQQRVKLTLQRDRLDYDKIKNQIKLR
ncbi:MAG: hypothetical protein CVU03_05005 [Bacteroidetes bacterium HGW-Bacteroidetes-2]|jgi:hypothetical protein|nr:MAG: hypothetical protein CVU03_05005 [Bacteroidetes bacterium HGW-Bacteroidetes-2]